MSVQPGFELLIAGAGGFGREVAAYAEDAIAAGLLDARLVGFLDDTDADPTRFGCPYPVVSTIDAFSPQRGAHVVVAIGEPRQRMDVAARLARKGADFASVIHPLAYVAASAEIGDGTVVAPFATVAPHAVLGQHCLINTHAGIGHDCRVAGGTVVSPHAVLNGWVEAEEEVFIGSGAVVTPRMRLGRGCKVAAGAVVYADVPAGATAHGNPARARRLPE